MKIKLLSQILIVFLLAGPVSVYAQSSTKEEAVNKVFNALRLKNEKEWVKIFPDAATTAGLLKKLMGEKLDSTNAEDEQMMKMLLEKLTDENLYAEYAQDFQRIMRKADRIGLNFSNAKIDKTIIDSSLESDTNVPHLNGKIYFSADKKQYFLAYTGIILFEGRGWYGVDVERLDEKSKENEPNEFDMEEYVMDSSVIIRDTVEVMPDTTKKYEPDPREMPEKKPADQKPKSKSKTKSDSPAKRED